MGLSEKITQLNADIALIENIGAFSETQINCNLYANRVNKAYPTDFSSRWVANGVTVQPVADHFEITETGNGWHELYVPVNCSNAIYTASFEVKAVTATKGRVWFVKTAQGYFIDFNLTTKTFVAGNFGGASNIRGFLEELSDGWFRVGVSGQVNLTNGYLDVSICENGLQYAGTGKKLKVRRPQFETGTEATDFIATTTGEVSIPASYIINTITPPVVLSKAIKARTPKQIPIDYAVLMHYDNGQNNSAYNDIEIFQDAARQLFLRVTRNLTTYYEINFGVYPQDADFTIAFSASTMLSACLNGVIFKQMPCVFPTDLSFERYGTQLAGIRCWQSHVSYEATFDRVLTEPELIALSK